jgi:hypothetical protein
MGAGKFTESVVEEATLDWLVGFGYTIPYGPEIATGDLCTAEDKSSNNDVLTGAAF